MRRSVLIILATCVVAALLLPAAANARASEYGYPWAGSYLQKVPRTMTVTHSRTIWLKFDGVFGTWADGATGWDQAFDNDGYFVYVMAHLKGSVTKVLKWEYTQEGTYDAAHPRAGIFRTGGLSPSSPARVKVRLTPGNGKKTVKIYFTTMAGQNKIGYSPNYPTSPIYVKTVKLVM